MAPTKYIDFTVTSDPIKAAATAEQALVARKFGVTWQDGWTATAERGSKVANAIAGAAAQYFKVGVRIMSADQGMTIIRIERVSSGWMGGAIGAARTTKNLKKLREELESTFSEAGVLHGVREG
jgi:hypothetical protein